MTQSEDDIRNCLTVMKNSGIILYPTDTIWGLGCDATDEKAIKKIYQLKKRAESKSMIILVSNEKMIRQYVSNPSERILEYLAIQSKPTTAIFDHAIHLPSSIVNTDGSIAIRIANEPFCQRLLQKLKKPLVSTSANVSGQPYPQNFPEISAEIKNGVDYIVQHRQNDLKKYAPSSIIKLDTSGEIIHLR
jgi:L-threonylcarbamoyladenylate synthase